MARTVKIIKLLSEPYSVESKVGGLGFAIKVLWQPEVEVYSTVLFISYDWDKHIYTYSERYWSPRTDLVYRDINDPIPISVFKTQLKERNNYKLKSHTTSSSPNIDFSILERY